MELSEQVTALKSEVENYKSYVESINAEKIALDLSLIHI